VFDSPLEYEAKVTARCVLTFVVLHKQRHRKSLAERMVASERKEPQGVSILGTTSPMPLIPRLVGWVATIGNLLVSICIENGRRYVGVAKQDQMRARHRLSN